MVQTSRRLLILGTRPFAAEIADLISEIPSWQLVGFVENWDRTRCAELMEGLPIHWVDDIAPLSTDHHAICSLATTHRVRFVEQVAAHGIPFATLVHPLARISSRGSLGEGTILSVGAIVAAHTRLGRHVLVNRGALIGHHVTVGDYVTLGPGVNVGGSCQIGEGAYVGMGANLLPNIKIGPHSVVGAGAVVTRDVSSHVQVTGVPARVVKEGISGK
jgi:sugar O-acyltransferase (sialic acid O-acetyltransferase NeuD family)